MILQAIRCVPRLIEYEVKIASWTIDVIEQEIRACPLRTIVPLSVQFGKETGVQRITDTRADNICRQQFSFGQANPITLVSRFNRQLIGHPPLTINIDAHAIAVKVIPIIHPPNTANGRLVSVKVVSET